VQPSESTAEAVPQAALQKPQTLQADTADVEVAKAAPPVEVTPKAASDADVAALVRTIDGPAIDRTEPVAGPVVSTAAWSDDVRQWSPDWVRYDDQRRPVLANPYRDPVQIVYVYDNAPRVAYIPPLQSIVLAVAQAAVYSFTAVVVNAINTVVNVAVGSFFGGGIVPALIDGVAAVAGLPAPSWSIMRYNNVPVQVRYDQATYQPFRVAQVVDIGNDVQYGERKVLLDGVTPAWGQWVQTPTG